MTNPFIHDGELIPFDMAQPIHTPSLSDRIRDGQGHFADMSFDDMIQDDLIYPLDLVPDNIQSTAVTYDHQMRDAHLNLGRSAMGLNSKRPLLNSERVDNIDDIGMWYD
jgi:hypothetical protein